jgi:CHAT domain-containing protein
VRAQASAVIAPLWSVNDQVAYHLATQFYEDVLGTAGTPPISAAEAMFKARQQPYVDVEVKDQAGETHVRRTATRLAYLVYGHPAFHP